MIEQPRRSGWSGPLAMLRHLPGLRSRERWKVAVASLLYVAGLGMVVGGAASVTIPHDEGRASITPGARGPLAALSDPTPSETGQPLQPIPAARRDPSPSPGAANDQPPQPSPSPSSGACGAASNPWGYGFCYGRPVTSPPPEFCAYFACTENFSKLNGRVVQCADGTFSRGTNPCPHHGGEPRPLYRSV